MHHPRINVDGTTLEVPSTTLRLYEQERIERHAAFRQARRDADAPHLDVGIHLFEDTLVQADGPGDTGEVEWVHVGNAQAHLTIYSHDEAGVQALIDALVKLRDKAQRY